MNEVLYRRPAVSRRGWLVPVVLWLAASLWVYFGAAPERTTFYLVTAVLAPGMIFGIWLITLASINRYGTVTVTHETLRVGRESVPVVELDPISVQAAAAAADPALRERVARSLGTVQLPGGFATTDARLLGGSFGTPVGSDQVVLGLRGGKGVIVPTNDRVGLLGALLTACRS